MTLCLRHSRYHQPVLSGSRSRLATVAAPAGYDVLIFDTDGRPEARPARSTGCSRGAPTAWSRTFFHLRVPQLAVLARKGIPMVRLESQHKPEDRLPIDSVYIDNAEASAAMTRHLIERGHQRIAMILAEFGPSHRRAFGYAAVMRAAGLARIRHRQPLFGRIRCPRHGSDALARRDRADRGVRRQRHAGARSDGGRA